jgi:tetratricopeptide (TPR) repeat protein
MTHRLSMIAMLCSVAVGALAQSSSPYVPGVTYQQANPNYPNRNPFYFEGRIDWNLLKITQPSNEWEYMERGIHKQDDLEDYAGAIADYQQSLAMANLTDKTCQLVTTAPPATGILNPPPCMFTPRLRLAGLLRATQPQQAIELYQEALAIDPLRLGVHAAIAETYVMMAESATDATQVPGLYQSAVTEFKAELANSPVTPLQTQVTGDTANNAHVHWELAEVYEKLSQPSDQMSELNLYLQATKWHSDTYPWRITLAQKKMAAAAGKASRNVNANHGDRQ